MGGGALMALFFCFRAGGLAPAVRELPIAGLRQLTEGVPHQGRIKGGTLPPVSTADIPLNEGDKACYGLS